VVDTRILYNRDMEHTLRKKRRNLYWPAFLLALGLGWLLYRFVNAETISLREAPPQEPNIVSRADWGARPLNLNAPEEFGLFNPKFNPEGVLTYSSDLRKVLNTIVIHHSAFSHASPAEIQGLHMDRRGYADVAYHFMIDSDGVIYEGREIDVRGAHVQGFNTGSVGIVLLGNFNESEPSQAQLDSMASLVDYLRFTYEIRFLAGHKDFPHQSPDGTACPGDNLYPLLPDLARKLGLKFGIDGYVTPAWAR